MAALLTASATAHPDRPAVADPDRALDRAALNDRVNRWIHLLRGHGVGVGDSVAVVAGNRVEVVELLLAGLHTGATVVPVNWHLVAGEIAHLLRDSGAVLAVADPQRAATVAEAAAACPTPPRLLLLDGGGATQPPPGWGAVEPLLATAPAGEPAEQHCGALMLYTSGTTGAPKGVRNGLFVTGAPFERVARLLRYAETVLGIPDRGTVALLGPWYHSAQLFFALLPLLHGARLVIRDRFDPAATLRLIDTEQVSHCHLVPTQFVRLLALEQPAREAFSGASLRRVWHGGGPCPIPVKQAMLDWWGECLVEYYAATEAGVVTLIDAAQWRAHPGSVGRAVPGTEVLVLDETGAPVPAGTAGRVHARRGTSRPFTYHNAPDQTALAQPEPGVFTYGEVGYLDGEGYLYLTGRFRDLIVTGGVNVHPAEVEQALLTHPAVGDAAVLGVADPEYGERVLAVVQPVPGYPAGPQLDAELDRHCRARLAGFKVPRGYRYLARLPREDTGKLRAPLLREQLAAAAAAETAAEAEAAADIAHPATYRHGVPHATFARLRRQAEVVWVDEPELRRHSQAGATVHRGSGYWAVLGHEAVAEACRRQADFSSGLRGAFLVDPRTRGDLERARELLVNMDDPRHNRIRRLVSSVFTPRAVRGLTDAVTGHAQAVVARAAARGSFDGVADVAAELPLLVLADLLGIPAADRGLLFRWSNQLVGFDDPEYGGGDIDAYRTAFAEAFSYALDLAQRRREHPGDDLASLIATAEVDGVRLSDREFCHFWLLLIVAGNESTRHLIAGSLLELARDTEQRDRLAAEAALVPTAVEELLRWVAPIMQFRRTARHDTELAGVRIGGGDKVVLYFTAANRDPRVFADPDRLDLARETNPHLTFGVGPHFCLGANLARLEAGAMLRALRPYLTRLRPAGEPVRLESNFVNGWKALPLRISPR